MSDSTISTSRDASRPIYFFISKKAAIQGTEIDTKYTPLSNYHMCDITYEDRIWKSNEAAYQASKFSDEEYIEAIRCARTPDESKRLGRQQAGQWTKNDTR